MSKRQSSDFHSYRAIRATYTPTTITVYQAYSSEIANSAVKAQMFKPPFSRTRMTWIKPSFLWMAYRSGWATKQHQERVLAIETTREGFEWALENSCLSHWDTKGEDATSNKDEWQQQLRASPVRVQWDPERDFRIRPLDYRAIQIGLGPEAVTKYIDEWIVSIVDVTATMHMIKDHFQAGDLETARKMLPDEQVYPIPNGMKEKIHAWDFL
ncbi:uncharacterized protein N7484_007834 [Penicillium longicatenatum]|uniref:uncharacterized protein n=1 Tax=Penicillium longicatenatum TaxID=1561947 RepID=UPI002547F4BB|nr:uncharacterized protein N7484_007834 [Penicillium longicatenatum]KAJ5639972.1 hypothetical protein N7484_007834 [Penicillium longicatenatum]